MLSLRITSLIILLSTITPFTSWGEEANEDVIQILSIHERVLQAHLQRDVDALLATTADDFVLVNRGEVSNPTKQERRERFAPYFLKTEFHEYKDLVPPIVQVSDGRDIAWLIAQVEVSGTQMVSGQEHPLQFVSAWIELYEKRDGTWVQTGNVSNFRQ